jgi:toxin ParE1/3/4
MPYQVIFSPAARKHIHELEEYLAERFYPGNVTKFIKRLTQACLSLASAPHRGMRREDLRPGMRTIGFERRVTIYFKVVEDQVVIMSLLYGGRIRLPEDDEHSV